MATPHSEDLRTRVIETIGVEGMSRRVAAKRFKVGDATAIRWIEAYEEEGRTKPLPVGGDRRSKLKPHRDWLLALRRAENDLTLEAIAGRLLAPSGAGLTPRCCRASSRPRGSASRRTVHASEQQRPDVADPRIPIPEEALTTGLGSPGQAFRPAQPPQNRPCRFPRNGSKHRPAH
jgi:putative transposase